MHVGIEDQLENEEAIIDHANVDHVEDNCNQNNGNMPLLEESGRHCLMNNTAWWMICVDSRYLSNSAATVENSGNCGPPPNSSLVNQPGGASNAVSL